MIDRTIPARDGKKGEKVESLQSINDELAKLSGPSKQG